MCRSTAQTSLPSGAVHPALRRHATHRFLCRIATHPQLVRAVCAGLRAKARRRQAVALAEDPREVRRLAIADEPRDIAYWDRRLLDQELCGCRHPPRVQVLVKAQLAELRIRALDLARRARDGPGYVRERQPSPVVPRDDDAREQVQPPAGFERVALHATLSDGRRPIGTKPAPSCRRKLARQPSQHRAAPSVRRPVGEQRSAGPSLRCPAGQPAQRRAAPVARRRARQPA
jgi:hypothetical protein